MPRPPGAAGAGEAAAGEGGEERRVGRLQPQGVHGVRRRAGARDHRRRLVSPFLTGASPENCALSCAHLRPPNRSAQALPYLIGEVALTVR